MPSKPTILIAAGGTGGHIFPGIAVANAMREIADVDVVFAGSPRGLETRIVPEHGYRLELLDVEPMKGGGPARAIRGALVAAKAMRHARGLVRKMKPAAVLSVGGYAAGPASLACVSQGVPLAILEPNSVLGLANRLLAPFAKRAYVAWAETARIFRGDKARLYGVPLRAGFEPRVYGGTGETTRRVLVLGGSQGATALNERLPSAIARVRETFSDVYVVHQSGRDREPAVREAYARAGVTGVSVAPFLDDISAQIAAADIVIARAGAVTVAEIASVGRAAIFVPFPHAADDHQAKNALALSELGGAVCVRQEAADDVRRVRMASAAREHGRPRAADDVARDLLALGRVALRGDGPKVDRSKNGSNGASTRMRISKEVS